MGYASLMLDLGVEADATIGIVGEGDAYTGFQHLACDVGHFAGRATRDDDSCVFPDRQADKPFFQGGGYELCHGDNATRPRLLSQRRGLAQVAAVDAAIGARSKS
ncbi:hypothetical protein D3227_34160 [Mesorhizobium waimense]|uniref:Uncharacterized protein n=3 Tax=Mesorhizobium TaxID=68287 RepID=A0A3A5K235_9HYPH|nr:hypothetical protein D3227_34160 [Mesorhizobium waimense]